MQTESYLVSIEAAGKQRYLAEAATSTEVAGASKMIRNLGMDAWNHISEIVVKKFSNDFDIKLHQQTSGSTELTIYLGKRGQHWRTVCPADNHEEIWIYSKRQ